MKFSDLTPPQIEYAREVYTNKDLTWDERMKTLMKFFGKGERMTRIWCSKKLGFKEKVEIEPEVLKRAKKKTHDKKKKRFLVTWAQNATPVHDGFFNNLKAYADFIDAEILVIPGRYKNPTSLFSEALENEEWWDEKVIPYLTLNRHDLNGSISVLGHLKIQPTSSNPLQGLEGMTGEHSSVVGHPRIELRSIPVMNPYKPKLLFTTGACTKPNFTDSKSGLKGEFHHSIGCCVIELKPGKEDVFFFRQISANKSGEFIDLFYHVKDQTVYLEEDVEAAVLGDVHVAHVDEGVIDKTLGHLFKKLNPKKLFIHDIFDSESISHHNLNNPFKLHQQEVDGKNSLEKEIDGMIKWLKKVERYNVYVVKSNHDVHCDRYLERDWRKESSLKNSVLYMELAMAKLKGDAPNGAIPYIINKHYPKFKCLKYDDVVMVKGYLTSVHGDLGANGSRGSLQQYSRLATKSVTGHSHSIGRIGGALSVGTSTKLRLDYNSGLSSWTNAHVIINRLNKAQHIVFMHTKDGVEYTTFE